VFWLTAPFSYNLQRKFFLKSQRLFSKKHLNQELIAGNCLTPRRTKNENLTPWDDQWHNVRLVRKMPEGTIEVFFDSADKPHMSVVDKTFEKGRIGIGSFDDIDEFDDIVVRSISQ